MQPRTLVISALAMLVIAPQVAVAGRARGAVAPPLAHGGAVRSKAKAASGIVPAKTAGHPASDPVYSAPWPSHAIATPDYIFEPASALSPDPLSQLDACSDFGVGCTVDELCSVWSICSPDAGAPAGSDIASEQSSTGTSP